MTNLKAKSNFPSPWTRVHLTQATEHTQLGTAFPHTARHVLGRTGTAPGPALSSMRPGRRHRTLHHRHELQCPLQKRNTGRGIKASLLGHLQWLSSLLTLKCCIDRGVRTTGKGFDFWQCFDVTAASRCPNQEISGRYHASGGLKNRISTCRKGKKRVRQKEPKGVYNQGKARMWGVEGMKAGRFGTLVNSPGRIV